MTAQNVEDFTHDFGPGFDRAVSTAVESIDVAQRIRIPEACNGFAIVRKTSPQGSVSYHVYDADAWEEPTAVPLLPWSAPLGEVIAHVSMDAQIHLTGNPRG